MTRSIQEWFERELAEKGIILNSRQLEQFELYYRELIAWNEKMNLTAITEKPEVYAKHFFDSLTLVFSLPMEQFSTVADVGSGAGFPGLPIKIVLPHLKLTLIDSLNKRVQFLHYMTETLKLRQVECVHMRAEEAGRSVKYRDMFDLVTSRAVARLPVLHELCLPLVKPGGFFAAMKGADPSEEIEEAKYSAEKLCAVFHENRYLTLPLDHSKRHILIYRKTGKTPKAYPRKPGYPKKFPLIKGNQSNL